MPAAPLFKTPLLQKTAVAAVMAVLLVGAVLGAQALAMARTGGQVTRASFITVRNLTMVAPTGWVEDPQMAAAVERQMGALRDVYVLRDPSAEDRTLLLASVDIPAPSGAVLQEFFNQRLDKGETIIEANIIQSAGVFNALTRHPEQGIVGHVMSVRTLQGKRHWLLHLRHPLAAEARNDAEVAAVREQFRQDVALMLHMLDSMQYVGPTR